MSSYGDYKRQRESSDHGRSRDSYGDRDRSRDSYGDRDRSRNSYGDRNRRDSYGDRSSGGPSARRSMYLNLYLFSTLKF